MKIHSLTVISLILTVAAILYPSYGNCQSCSISHEENLFTYVPFKTGLATLTGWARTYGSSNYEQVESVLQTSDGGYIAAGEFDPSGTGYDDAWVIKLDLNGAIVWQNIYGGSGSDWAQSIRQTSDGGYIIAGGVDTVDGSDMWIAKLNPNGTIAWQKAYGIPVMYDRVRSIQETSDGGYIAAGDSGKLGYDVIWVLKLDANGEIIWQKKYDGGSQSVYYVQQTTDGGYFIAGSNNNFSAGGYDFWVLKLDTNGAIVWQKTYGGSNHDGVRSAQQTLDGGYIVTGYTQSFGAGDIDVWVLKLDANGTAVWQNTYGGAGYDYPTSLQQTSDGGYIIAGETSSFGAGMYDALVIKLDANGAIIWQKTYGGNDQNSAHTIQQTSDGGYIIAGETSSFGAGMYDAWVIKLDAYGNAGSTCSFIGISYAVSSSTSVTPTDSSAVASDLSIIPYYPSIGISSIPITTAQQCPYLQPFQGIKPAVDDTGSSTPNGIIEPDEAVILRGHLENIGSVDAVNTTGVLYTNSPVIITQPNALYGTIVAGGNQICTTCYDLIAPSNYRPALHWDFSVTEQVSADAYSPENFQYAYHVGNSFSDVTPASLFYSYIEKILHAGVTGGCTATAYCPSATVQRQAMAKFICAAMNAAVPDCCQLEASCAGIFADVPSSNIFCTFIEGLYASGVTGGCNASPLQYCPGNNVLRDSMAKFICNAMNHCDPGSCIPTSCTGIFTDVPTSNIFCGNIEALYNAGIVSGCSSSLYCPGMNVSRAQMAKFLVNAFGFAL